jgi:uncharacterized protein YndB with AHSA1/START domain
MDMEDVVFSIDIEAPVQAAWDELTKVGAVQYPMFNAVLETDWKPGSQMLYYKPDRTMVFVVGQVVEVDEPNRFVHTYRFTDLDDDATLVTWDFQPIETGVRVTVTHSRFTDQTDTAKRVEGGWKLILGILKSILETGKKPLKARAIYGIMGALSFLQPKKIHTENVLAALEADPGFTALPGGGAGSAEASDGETST